MAVSSRNVPRTKKATSHEAAPSTSTPGSDQTPRPEGTSGVGHRISDDAAGDEGIDVPAESE